MLMSQVTTLQIGGPAREFVVAKTEQELIDTIKSAKKDGKDFLVIGGGSNLLVSDEGIDKLIIKNDISGIERSGDIIRVKAGTPLQKLVDFTISNGLSGLQKMTGIPGTVGGAIYGNAGAYGQTISDHLVSVKVIDPTLIASEDGNPANHLRGEDSDVPPAKLLGGGVEEPDRASNSILTLTKDQCQFGYRDSGFKRNGQIILEVTFSLTPDDPTKLKQEAEETLSKRLVKYPPNLKCPGSFFKNILAQTLPQEILSKIPEDKIPYSKVSVGYLLEEVGAKGAKRGNIEVAPYHANLFINLGGGNAEDFYNLAKDLAQKVKQKFGITLEPEVQLINLPPLI